MASGDTIFLSSTTADLADFRAAAIHVAQRLGMRVASMEDFGPDPRNAATLCEEKVASADVFLGLYAYRYGFEPDGFGGRSMIELEYEWAVRAGLTILVFMADDDHPWPPKYVDTGESRQKLEHFKGSIRKEHVIAHLTTPERLREDLFVHLPKFRTERPARTPSGAGAIPAPPRPYIAHTYTLLQTEQVIGRAAELALLDRWAGDPADPLHAAHVLCLVAIGGMGKSALTWKWMHDHAPVSMQPLAGRLWWSFYETDAGFDQFVTAALAYCTGRSAAAAAEVPRADREVELLAVLNEKPFLLVLDGVERLLIAYAGMDFAHLADDDLDRRTANVVAGALGLPGGDADALVSQHRLRKTIDPHVGNFLRKLSRIQSARVLITTRLYPSELQTVTGRELPGCAAVFLRGLAPQDALALWRGMGVSGSDEELAELFARFDHYPLLIRALSGEVARFRRAPGDFDAWRRAHPGFDPFSLPLVQAKSHVLAHSLGNLYEGAEEVLHTIAAFRSPADYDTLLALFGNDGGANWSADKLDTVLTELEDRGLLGWDKAQNRYDLHPIVRGVVWNELDPSGRHGVYDSLRSHFEAFPLPSKNVTSLADVRPGIELFNALVGLGRYKEAAEIYFDRIFTADGAFIREGAVNEKIAMLESLFPIGLDYPPGSSKDRAVLSQLGHAYRAAGRLQDALLSYSRSFQLAVSTGRPLPHLSYKHLAEAEVLCGQLRAASNHAKHAVESRDSLTKTYEATLAICEAITGDTHVAIKRLRNNDFDSPYLAQIAFWQGEYKKAVDLAVPEGSGIWVMPVMIADARLNLGQTTEAAALLHSELREAIAQSLPHNELQARRALAELLRREGELGQAREVLGDLWELAERGGYRLVLADASLVLTRIERDAGKMDAAREAAQEAYRQAYCDGPPYTYHWALEQARALIEELGATLPDVPPPES